MPYGSLPEKWEDMPSMKSTRSTNSPRDVKHRREQEQQPASPPPAREVEVLDEDGQPYVSRISDEALLAVIQATEEAPEEPHDPNANIKALAGRYLALSPEHRIVLYVIAAYSPQRGKNRGVYKAKWSELAHAAGLIPAVDAYSEATKRKVARAIARLKEIEALTQISSAARGRPATYRLTFE